VPRTANNLNAQTMRDCVIAFFVPLATRDAEGITVLSRIFAEINFAITAGRGAHSRL